MLSSLLIAGCLIAADPAASGVLKSEVENLVLKLNDDHADVRTKAEAQLIKLGPSALDVLPSPELQADAAPRRPSPRHQSIACRAGGSRSCRLDRHASWPHEALASTRGNPETDRQQNRAGAAAGWCTAHRPGDQGRVRQDAVLDRAGSSARSGRVVDLSLWPAGRVADCTPRTTRPAARRPGGGRRAAEDRGGAGHRAARPSREHTFLAASFAGNSLGAAIAADLRQAADG